MLISARADRQHLLLAAGQGCGAFARTFRAGGPEHVFVAFGEAPSPGQRDRARRAP